MTCCPSWRLSTSTSHNIVIDGHVADDVAMLLAAPNLARPSGVQIVAPSDALAVLP